ncbi:hypothetical protein D3C81_1799250 [compost metagenome]
MATFLPLLLVSVFHEEIADTFPSIPATTSLTCCTDVFVSPICAWTVSTCRPMAIPSSIRVDCSVQTPTSPPVAPAMPVLSPSISGFTWTYNPSRRLACAVIAVPCCLTVVSIWMMAVAWALFTPSASVMRLVRLSSDCPWLVSVEPC